MQPITQSKPWAGRFTVPTNELVEIFTASINFDYRLAIHDIRGSIAHARMLQRIGVLTTAELILIENGLNTIQAEIERGEFPWEIRLEDVHMNIEARLIERIGNAGKKLHTGRSRNDQVATDIRLWLRDEIDALLIDLIRVQQELINLVEREIETIMPGLTHLQIAQPITLGHHLLAWFEMLQRDRERLRDSRKRVNVMPLGSAALAGTSYPLDRSYTAELLGFEAISENSLDAVSDRDFAIEFTACASLIMVHLSRFSEELILWSTPAFDFVELSDAFCTGSSIMPQKKNPDVPELVRGKTGRVIGNLIALLTLMKAQPLAYNKDNQEDKEPLFDTVNTVRAALQIYAAMLPELHFKQDQMRAALRRGFATATDLADYLVRRGLPFRDAHEAVGQAVRLGIETGRDLAEISLTELQSFAPLIAPDVYDILTVEGSVASRNHFGATAPEQIHKALDRARARLLT